MPATAPVVSSAPSVATAAAGSAVGIAPWAPRAQPSGEREGPERVFRGGGVPALMGPPARSRLRRAPGGGGGRRRSRARARTRAGAARSAPRSVAPRSAPLPSPPRRCRRRDRCPGKWPRVDGAGADAGPRGCPVERGVGGNTGVRPVCERRDRDQHRDRHRQRRDSSGRRVPTGREGEG